jgi:hypothetical protein
MVRSLWSRDLSGVVDGMAGFWPSVASDGQQERSALGTDSGGTMSVPEGMSRRLEPHPLEESDLVRALGPRDGEPVVHTDPHGPDGRWLPWTSPGGPGAS